MALARATPYQGVAPERWQRTGQTSARRGGGAYRGSGTETIVAHLPGVRSGRWGPTVVFCHSVGGSALDAGAAFRPIADAFLAAGCPVLAADLGGPTTWANDDSLDAFDDALAYGAAQWGTRTDRIAIVGASMGCTILANAAWRNIGRVAFLYSLVPIVGVDLMIATPFGSLLAAGVYAAFGSQANWNAAAPTRDPIADAVAKPLNALGERYRLDIDDQDVYQVQATYEAYMAKVPAADLRIYRGNHFTPHLRDFNELHQWARRMATTYG